MRIPVSARTIKIVLSTPRDALMSVLISWPERNWGLAFSFGGMVRSETLMGWTSLSHLLA